MLKEPVTAERVERMIEQIDGLFNRGNDGWGGRSTILDCEALIVPFALGQIRLKLDRIGVDLCHRAAAETPTGRRSEGSPHLYMKSAALVWFARKGIRDAEPEVGMHGGRVDVYSDKANWIVECGNTRVTKLRDAIEAPTSPRFTLIPYQRSAYRARSGPTEVRPLRMVHFEWDTDLRQQLNEERFAKLRNSVTRNPNSPFVL